MFYNKLWKLTWVTAVFYDYEGTRLMIIEPIASGTQILGCISICVEFFLILFFSYSPVVFWKSKHGKTGLNVYLASGNCGCNLFHAPIVPWSKSPSSCCLHFIQVGHSSLTYIYIYLWCGPLTVTVTTRIITFLVGGIPN